MIEKNQPSKPYRCWINQPSTLQPYHRFHREMGMAVIDGELATFAFLSGDVNQFMQIPAKYLTMGWGISNLSKPSQSNSVKIPEEKTAAVAQFIKELNDLRVKFTCELREGFWEIGFCCGLHD